MTFPDCLDFVRRNPNVFLATVDGGRPHVRPMTVWLADETGVYFYTTRVKPLFAQLLSAPHVEVAFHQPAAPPDIGTVVRIGGAVEIVEDLGIHHRLYETIPWLETIPRGTPDGPTIVVFRISRGEFNFWTWENNIHPEPWLPFP